MNESRKILLVEDNSLNLKLFKDVLLTQGFETIEDPKGDQVLSLATEYNPDIIVLDVELPQQSGPALARKLKSIPKSQHIPILAVTAHVFKGKEQEMLDAGCEDCLTKPFTIGTFLNAIDSILANKNVVSH